MTRKHGRSLGLRIWAAALVLAAAGSVFAGEPGLPESLADEGVFLLSRYIQIDTSNPPGNELRAAEFFKRIFDREGIESRIIESAPGRGNIYARLRGTGARKGVLLLNHMDVVPAEAALWKEPPFSGAIKDGYVWGRGAWDMKGPAIVELMTLLALKRGGLALDADVIFLGTADEEAGGALGAGFLLENHPELFEEVGLVLNEGGGIRAEDDGRVREYNVSVAEKTPLWLRLTATGTAGHGSTPGRSMAVHKLIAALGRIMQYQSPIKVIPEVQRFYAETASSGPPALQARYLDLRRALEDPVFAAEFTSNPQNNASVRNTIAITGLRGSEKINVIGASASADLDIRLLPGEKPEEFLNELRKAISDDSIKLEVLLSFPAVTSPPHPEAMRVLSGLARDLDGAPVVSRLVRGFTDCHFFRERGIPCLGFIPRRSTPADEGRAHGVDERMPVESFKRAIRTMFELVRRLTTE